MITNNEIPMRSHADAFNKLRLKITILSTTMLYF